MLTTLNTFKALVIGKSHTGKTYMVVEWCNEIIAIRNRRMTIAILTPNKSSYEQPTWKMLDPRFIVNKYVLNKDVKKPSRSDIYIIDDVDNLTGQTKLWVQELFTVESHHQDSIVFMISHILESGSPALRYSSDYIVIKDIPRVQLDEIKVLTAEEKNKILRHLQKGVIMDKGQYRNYSYVVYVNGAVPYGSGRLFTRSNIFLWPI